MRIWSLHPSHLDAKGLVACWRETLLAQKVLRGLTTGYRDHPQLTRFRATVEPVTAIGTYLHGIADEADARGYRFDRARIVAAREDDLTLPVTGGQLAHEWSHLLGKLEVRDPPRCAVLLDARPRPHPLFRVVDGPVEAWERGAGTAQRASDREPPEP